MAFLVLLDPLVSVERAVFMLREVFGYGCPEVARITGKTEVNCRQILARVRQRITPAGQARDSAHRGRRYAGAARHVAPDVVHGDGGKAQAIGKPLAGRQRRRCAAHWVAG
jgi:hypothetical protein